MSLATSLFTNSVLPLVNKVEQFRVPRVAFVTNHPDPLQLGQHPLLLPWWDVGRGGQNLASDIFQRSHSARLARLSKNEYYFE